MMAADDLREALVALADEWQANYDRWKSVHDGPRVAIFHAHANRLRALIDAHPAPSEPEATVVEECAGLSPEAVREREAAAWDAGYSAGEHMAHCWGHVDHWEPPFPANPYRKADR